MARRRVTLVIEFEEGQEDFVRSMVFPAFAAAQPVEDGPIVDGIYGMRLTWEPNLGPEKIED